VPVRAVVDEQQKIGDCHPENNTAVSGAVKCSPPGEPVPLKRRSIRDARGLARSRA